MRHTFEINKVYSKIARAMLCVTRTRSTNQEVTRVLTRLPAGDNSFYSITHKKRRLVTKLKLLA